MRAARLATLALVLLVTPLVATAPAMQSSAPGAPTGLRGFELRPNEPMKRTFARTPAFAWNPVRGAACYEFELATSQSFSGSSVIWSNVPSNQSAGQNCRPVTATFPKAPGPASETASAEPSTTVTQKIAPIRIPAVAIDLTLPWFNASGGNPLHARVRSVSTRGASQWSKPFSFDMRWENLPTPRATRPGLVRWAPVDGATGYEVWFGGRGPNSYINKIVKTHTNVADLRDVYTFHSDEGWWRTVTWRVRAMRHVIGALPNGLPAVSYGPWSPVYAATNPSWASGRIRLGAALSDQVSSGGTPAHRLMPALTWNGDQALDGSSWRLFRTYVFTDRDCVNVVFRGSVVGSPVFSPRINGPLKLPKTEEELAEAEYKILPSNKTENAKTFTADTFVLTSNESFEGERSLLRVDLPDLDARATRYFWTVVPVVIVVNLETGELEYWDYESPQDACRAGRVGVFGKVSDPAVTTSGSPFVAGLSPKGRLLAQAGKKPTVYSTPLIAWRPVLGATGYEIQWSRSTYPWRTSGSRTTVATSSVLDLPAGLWYYRVRGLNVAQVGTPAMPWSQPTPVKVVKPTFKISRG